MTVYEVISKKTLGRVNQSYFINGICTASDNPNIVNDLLVQRYRADHMRALEHQLSGTEITTIIRRAKN